MQKYLAIFRVRFINSLQYRTAALAGIATQFAWGFMEILAFQAFYRVDPSSFPMTLSQTVTYIWMQQALLALFMNWFFEPEIFNAVMSGSIAYELARPIDLYNRWLCQAAANRLARAVLRCMPILFVAFLLPEPFRLSPPASLAQFFLFVIAAVLGLGVIVSFSMLVYISTFYTLSPTGTRLIAAVLADFLAGATIPLPFFPQPLRMIAEWLPFAAMQNMPLRIYSGHIAGADALSGILLQMFWLTVLIMVGRVLMKRTLRHVVVQGG